MFFSQCIHTRPESGMCIAAQLTIFGEPFDGLPLPGCVVTIDVVQNLGIQYKETSADPSLTFTGLFKKGRYFVFVDRHLPEACRSTYSSYRRKLSMSVMELD